MTALLRKVIHPQSGFRAPPPHGTRSEKDCAVRKARRQGPTGSPPIFCRGYQPHCSGTCIPQLCTRSTYMHSVYRLYSGKRAFAQCLQTTHSVYKPCKDLHVSTVSTDCTRVDVHLHSVYKPCTVSTNHAQGLHVCTMSTDCTRVNVHLHTVYKPRTVSTNHAQDLHVCTMSTDYTRVNVHLHSVYKPRTVSTNHAQGLHVCTMSTDYTRVNVHLHSVYKPRHRIYM